MTAMNRHRPKIKHGLSEHPLYKRWHMMKARCESPNIPAYQGYGARGIKVCERWQNFANFLGDMGECPEGLTIERRDNKGDYCPENCYWASRAKQMRNTRRNRLYTIDGVTKPRLDWCEEHDINVSTFRARMRNGWAIEDALCIPALKIGPYHK